MNHTGTGLGLSICKQIISQLGGKAQVKSNIGEGTQFIITVPFQIQDYNRSFGDRSQEEFY